MHTEFLNQAKTYSLGNKGRQVSTQNFAYNFKGLTNLLKSFPRDRR